MTEQIGNFVREYWIIFAAIALFFVQPDGAKALLAKVGIGSKAEDGPEDDLDLVNELARANKAGGYGAEDEIQIIFKKFTGAK